MKTTVTSYLGPSVTRVGCNISVKWDWVEKGLCGQDLCILHRPGGVGGVVFEFE